MSKPTDAPQEAAAGKPRFALFIATACGLGYIPKAPGTFGSLAGLIVYVAVFFFVSHHWTDVFLSERAYVVRGFGVALTNSVVLVLIGSVGVWVSDKVARFLNTKDPQIIVVDEVSGQHLAFVLGTFLPPTWNPAATYWRDDAFGFSSPHSVLSWKYLLVGFILFRVFDIWKPFPVRQAESLPGGWGIMADDWIAGIYAGIGLWIARAAGL